MSYEQMKKKCPMIFIGKVPLIDPEVKEVLREMDKNLKEALRKGEEYVRTSTKKWGGSPGPFMNT